MREVIQSIDPSLHLGKDKKPLGSRNLLQRLVLIASIVTKLRPRIGEVANLVDQSENTSKLLFEEDIRIELASILSDVRSDFAAIAFLYDLRVHGGIAHPPNKAKAAEAAIKLGLSAANWTRGDFLQLVQSVNSSINRTSSRLNDATSTLMKRPEILTAV